MGKSRPLVLYLKLQQHIMSTFYVSLMNAIVQFCRRCPCQLFMWLLFVDYLKLASPKCSVFLPDCVNKLSIDAIPHLHISLPVGAPIADLWNMINPLFSLRIDAAELGLFFFQTMFFYWVWLPISVKNKLKQYWHFRFASRTFSDGNLAMSKI